MSWKQQTISRAIIAMALVAMLCGGCTRRQGYIRPVDAGRRGPPATCMALSVGGADGLVHVGAIQAAKDAGVDITCVAGTSMGALIGALYASAPDTNLEERVSKLLKRYSRSVKRASLRP